MKNEYLFKLKEVIMSMKDKDMSDVDFAFEVVDLEDAIDEQITKVQSVIDTSVKFSDKDKQILGLRQQLQGSISIEERENMLKHFNELFSDDDLKTFNEKDNDVAEILRRENKTKLPKLSKDKLPSGLKIDDYRTLKYVL